jgi:hypothetical protein
VDFGKYLAGLPAKENPHGLHLESMAEGKVCTLPSPIDSRWTPLDSTWTYGVHVESMWIFLCRQPSQIFPKVHLDSRWIPGGLRTLHLESMESTPLHLLDIGKFTF